jgi:hypothetical protein
MEDWRSDPEMVIADLITAVRLLVSAVDELQLRLNDKERLEKLEAAVIALATGRPIGISDKGLVVGKELHPGPGSHMGTTARPANSSAGLPDL